MSDENGWRDMNSAPYNKTKVALIALRSDGSWKTGTGWYMPLTGWQGFDERPTHWYPLPPFDSRAELSAGNFNK